MRDRTRLSNRRRFPVSHSSYNAGRPRPSARRVVAPSPVHRGRSRLQGCKFCIGILRTSNLEAGRLPSTRRYRRPDAWCGRPRRSVARGLRSDPPQARTQLTRSGTCTGCRRPRPLRWPIRRAVLTEPQLPLISTSLRRATMARSSNLAAIGWPNRHARHKGAEGC